MTEANQYDYSQFPDPRPKPVQASPATKNGAAPQTVPLADWDAEEHVLGAILLAGAHSHQYAAQLLHDLTAILGDGTAFERDTHRHIYRAAQTVCGRGEPTTADAVTAELDRAQQLKNVTGGATKVMELAAIAPSTSNAPFKARIVADLGQRRRHMRVLERATRQNLLDGLTDDNLAELRTIVDAPLAHGPAPSLALPLEEFLALDLQSPPPLLGTDQDTIIPTGGLVVIAGMPGAGKTTLILDAVFHLASGQPWLDFPVHRPLNILLIENEGPQHKFQAKLRNKTTTWPHQLTGKIRIHTWKWGAFTFRNPEDANLLRQELDDQNIDIVVGDPLDTLGTEGVGSPENTSEFLRMLVPLGLTNNRTFIFLHHFRKEISNSEINQVSGAWGQRLDTLLVLRTTDQPDELRLSFPKLRWGDDQHAEQPLILGKLRDKFGFELLRHETHEPEPSEDAVENMLRTIMGFLRKRGGTIERQVLAMHCETSLANRTFTKALATGYRREILAKETAGRKILYSLTPEAYL